MKKKSKVNGISICFAAFILVMLVLVVVGMCVSNINYTIVGKTQNVTLFDEMWSNASEVNNALDTNFPQPTFAIIAFVIALVGIAILLIDSCLRLLLKKNFKLICIIGAAVTFIGAVLILVAGLVLVNDLNSYYADINSIVSGIGSVLGKDLEVKPYSLGAGIWLGFIGGLLAAASGGLSLLKVFNK